MNEKTREFIRVNAGYFSVAAVSLIYVATAVIRMGETGKTVGQIIAEGAASFFVGYLIARLLDLQGIMAGERDPKFLATQNLHSELVVKISPHIEKLDGWCERQNEEALRLARIKILAAAGMRYSDYFENGAPKDFVFKDCKTKEERKNQRSRYRAYKRALKPKLTELTSGELTGEGAKIDDANYLGPTKEEYETRTSTKDAVSKILLSLLFGYYGVDMIADFSYALLIYRALQVGIFVTLGIVKMYRSYCFIVDEYRGRIVKKINNLQKFDNDITKGETLK